jgi:hypothetical protein
MGLGSAHEAARIALLAAMRDGDPCARCGQPMHLADELDADHVSTPRALGDPRALPDALSHASCNRRHGARLGLALRGLTSSHRPPPTPPRAEPLLTSRDW